MLCRRNSVRVGGSIPVYLNVYDISPTNGYMYWLGLGVHHSGVQVHGVEYAFGAHERPTTGIFQGEPKKWEGFKFRESILIGWTELSAGEVRLIMEEFAKEYKGNTYNLITKNCNDFCNDACIRLTGNRIPGWVNRLAKIGFLCNCLIPTLKTEKKDEIKEIKKDRRSSSSRITMSSPDNATTTASNCSLKSSSSSSSTPILDSNTDINT